MRHLCLRTAMLLAAAGCAREGTDADTTRVGAGSSADTVRVAASVANAIEANPAAADSILRASGHTRESFEKLMYDIAADSTKSATYAAAKAR